MYQQYEELGSIIKFFYENHDRKNMVKLYYKEVPKDFETPSIYFRTPSIVSNIFTTQSFNHNYMWIIKVFDEDSETAQFTALNLINKIACNRYMIPVYNADNTITNRYVRVANVDYTKVDEGVIQIELRFNLAYFFNRPDYIKFMEFNLSEQLKEG